MNNKETVIKIIEFYLSNQCLISAELQYRRQMRNTDSFITINKLYKPISFAEMDCLYGNINNTVMLMSEFKKEYIYLRYKKKCTYDVICGLLNKKRSTVFSLGVEILDVILFNIMSDNKAREYILNTERKRYLLPGE